MSLEIQLKQKHFKNEQTKAGINILFTAAYLSNYQGPIFKRYGITVAQYNLLRILKGQLPNSASINLLIDRMLDKNSNASRIVEKLRVKNLVERIQNPDDRRAVNVTITEKGIQLIAKMDATELELFGGLNNLTDEQAEMLNDLLDKARTK
jgi:DNA-binding MarR family transcriptional regulator